MVIDMYKTKQLLPFLLLLSLLMLAFLLYYLQGSSTAVSYCRYPDQTLILDAGHGGEDGGAVALSGAAESQINLSIALKTDQMCGLYGVQTILVRAEDTSLADADADTLRQKKHTDLINRTELVNSTPRAVLLSIHQNNYSRQSSRGAQVFYHADSLSQQWALQMQELLRQTLDPENVRQATQIPERVYLMNHVNCRALLVECGFLSNPEEDQLLESASYQSKLAAVLIASYLTFDETAAQHQI